MRDFFRLAADGALPSDLASLANRNAWKGQDGEIGKWTARRIIALMKNPIYLGMIRNGNSTLPGEHEAIVSCDLFDSVQQQLAGRRTRQPQPRDGKRPDNPWGVNLSGLLSCGQCDRPMSTSISHRGPIRYIYYCCRSNAGGRKPCPGANVSAYELERFIGGVLASDPVIPDDLRRFWRTLDALTQQKSLTKFVDRVVYHHAGGRISVTVRDDWDVVASSERM